MSAFVVSSDHIDALITFAVDRRVSYYNPKTNERTDITSHNAEEIGRILLDENVRSVVHRYENSSPDFADENKQEAAEYKYRRFHGLGAVQIIKACSCFDYQACETEDYESTLAWRIIEAIRSAACRALPGYEQAAWEIHRPAKRGAA